MEFLLLSARVYFILIVSLALSYSRFPAANKYQVKENNTSVAAKADKAETPLKLILQ